MNPEHHRDVLQALQRRRHGDSSHIDLTERDLERAMLPRADLVGVDFSRSNLSGASLRGAKLSRISARNIDLTRCHLDGADLTDADLSGADLTGASLDDSILAGANLCGACLREIHGAPLSLAGAKVNNATLERSGMDERAIAKLLKRGVSLVKSDSSPPSVSVPTDVNPSLINELHEAEFEARRRQAEHDEEEPPSSRPLGIEHFDSSFELSEPHNERPSEPPPSLSAESLARYPIAQVGDEVLGVKLERELSRSAVCRTFLARDADDNQVVYKTFNYHCEGAALHLPAFQRGLRALNAAQPERAQETQRLHIVELLTVSTDLTSFVTPFYENGDLSNLVGVDVTLDTALSLFESICECVIYFHSRGLLVRSLKPGKILIDGLDPVLGEVDMVDLPTLQKASSDLDGYGPFAAPEEVAGTGTRSPTSCVFVLGRLLEYLVTGKTPVTPYGVEPDFTDHVPPALKQVVARCTRLDPLDRYPYARDVLEDVKLAHEKGSSVVLNSWIHPGTLSRVDAPLVSFAPPAQKGARTSVIPGAPRAPSFPPASRANSQTPKAPRATSVPAAVEFWESPTSSERRVAQAAVLLSVLSVAAIFFAPSAQATDAARWILIPALGLLGFWLPRPSTHPRRFRAATVSALCVFASWLEPTQFAALRWQYQAQHGDVHSRAFAVLKLIRAGERSFVGQDLSGLNLAQEDLGLTNFEGASLAGAQLSESLFLDSNLANADFAKADVTGADFRATNLAAARGLDEAICDETTRFPSGLRCESGTVRK